MLWLFRVYRAQYAYFFSMLKAAILVADIACNNSHLDGRVGLYYGDAWTDNKLFWASEVDFKGDASVVWIADCKRLVDVSGERPWEVKAGQLLPWKHSLSRGLTTIAMKQNVSG